MNNVIYSTYYSKIEIINFSTYLLTNLIAMTKKMKGVEFLRDYQGNLKSVLINLEQHQQFWQEVLQEIGKPVDFQFLVNDNSEPISVLLEFPKHEELWFDIYDALITDDLEEEPSISWQEIKKDLQLQKKVSV